MAQNLTVTLNPMGFVAKAEPGDLLSEVAERVGVSISLPCGHQGRCGRCAVRVEQGKVRRRVSAQFGPKETAEGWVLACQTEVAGDVVVHVPPRKREHLVTSPARRVPRVEVPELAPAVRKAYLEMEPPALGDNLNDWDRLVRALRQQEPDLDIRPGIWPLRSLATQLRASDWRVTATLARDSAGGPSRLMGVDAGNTTRKLYGVAIDIGTTTVVVNLVDLRAGRVRATVADYNDQIACGEDVISRIIYAQQGTGAGLARLRDSVARTINRLVSEACERWKIDPEDVLDVVVAGNTTMTHLFHGLDPRYIRMEPYIPTANHFPVVRAGEAGLHVHPEAGVWTYPTVAAYVGGDITSGVISSGMFKTDKLTLFMDVGTNGEIVLGNSDWLMACACSAGPAFEGAGVRCGMRATVGAIEDVSINERTLEPFTTVIGREKPVGICGSGMISALSELFQAGIVDRQGRIDVERVRPRMLKPERVRRGDHGGEYVLAWADDTNADHDIVLTEVDIDNLIRTKGAIYAGITSLVRSVGVEMADVEQVLIGGSFGQHLDVDHAVRIGLLPDLPRERFQFLGNTSLHGAFQALLSEEYRALAEEVAGRMTYLELVADPSYYDEYTSALFLPHTDLATFPSVARGLSSPPEL